MKHYWINIDSCVDRKEFMEQQFSNHGIQHQRVSADTPDTMKNYSIIRHPESNEKPEETCCILSHLKALQQGYEDGEEFFCVTEDDVNIPKLDFDKIKKYIKDAEYRDNTKVEMLQLYTSGYPYIINMLNNNVSKHEYVIKREQCCPATVYYMATRTGAKKLLDRFKIGDGKYDLSYSAWAAADNLLYRPINTYIVSYPLTTTNIDYGSIIHTEHLGNHQSANLLIQHIHRANNLMHLFT
jgi:GR25 family glycosyltransferase involved in LPS biosynthesis